MMPITHRPLVHSEIGPMPLRSTRHIRNRDPFVERLNMAFEELTPGRMEYIRRIAEGRGIHGGDKSVIAALIGMNSQSLLSDMLAGNKQGARYHEPLAELLGVPLAWLRGCDDVLPDWALPADVAFIRWARLVQNAALMLLGPESSSDAHLHSASRTGQAGVISSHKLHADRMAQYAGQLAGALDLRPDAPAAKALISARWADISWNMLVSIADRLAVPYPGTPEHIEHGHRQCAGGGSPEERDIAKVLHALRRFWLPGPLFQATRVALLEARQARARDRLDHREIDDALEILWRQQLQIASNADDHRKPVMPPLARHDLGLEDWTPLRRIHRRYPKNQH
jgi:hypothetical protein